MPQIEVSFDIDANGVVKVSAKDKATSKEQQIRIQSSGGLSEEEIKKMMRDAEENASSDKLRKETIEAKNQADSLIYETEKSLREHGDKVDSSIKNVIEEDLKNLKEVLAKEDANADEIKKSTESLMQNSMKLGEAIYKNSQNPQQPDQQPEANSTDSSTNNSANEDGGKVVDGEYEVKDDKKS
jgi:molecular chaperone DnaK